MGAGGRDLGRALQRRGSHESEACHFKCALTSVAALDVANLRAPECAIEPKIPATSNLVNGGVFQTGGFPDLDLSFLFCPFLSFFVLFGTCPVFLGFSRFAREWTGDFPYLSFSSLSAY